MKKDIINTENAPAAIGPYVQGIRLEDLVFTSGQLPIDPKTGDIPESVYDQTIVSLNNVQAVLQAAGSDLSKAIKLGVFIKNMDEFGEVNRAYATFFPEDAPCRTTVEVARLPKDALVEIDAIAHR